MINSNRVFAFTKLKNNVKVIDSFITSSDETLLILTSIGRLFKFNLSNNHLSPSTKQAQGLLLVKLLPTEKVVSCCKSTENDDLFLISQKGKVFNLKNYEVYYAMDSKLGYLNLNTQLIGDSFIKILTNNDFVYFETNKNKSARLNLDKLNFKSTKKFFEPDFLNLEKDEYLENCFRLKKIFD